MSKKTAFALAAHPDDIEFQMAGTLILLKQAGYEIHYMNLANGCFGSKKHSKEEIIAIRAKEAKEAADSIGAIFHPSMADDLHIFYNEDLLSKLAALMRQVSPEILLLQSPQDYMEDHQNTARLGATAAFSMGMPNFPTNPAVRHVEQEVAIYHAQPHGNRDVLNHVIQPDIIVDITSVIEQKAEMLSFHKSQKEWLDESQDIDEMTQTMKDLGREVAKMSGSYSFAEGWRQRLHYGYSDATFNPLVEVLEAYVSPMKSEDDEEFFFPR